MRGLGLGDPLKVGLTEGGAATLFIVLASQTDYILAESNLVNQIINYRRNELTLLQRTSRLLEERGIVVN